MLQHRHSKSRSLLVSIGRYFPTLIPVIFIADPCGSAPLTCHHITDGSSFDARITANWLHATNPSGNISTRKKSHLSEVQISYVTVRDVHEFHSNCRRSLCFWEPDRQSGFQTFDYAWLQTTNMAERHNLPSCASVTAKQSATACPSCPDYFACLYRGFTGL